MADPDLQRNASADPDLQRNASALSFLQSIELTSCPIKCDTIDTRCDDETPTISPEPRSNSSPGENGSKIKIQVTPVPESASETISAAYAFLNSIPLTRDESFTENGAERGADVMSPPSKKSSGDLDDPEAAAAAFFDGIPLHRLESMDDSNASGSPGGSVSGSMSDSGASLHPPGHAMRHSNSLQRHSRRQFTGFLLPATSATSKRSRMQARNLKQKESVDDKHDSREHDTKPEAVSRQSSTVLALDDVNVSERQYVLLSTREVSESRLRLSTPRMSIVCSFSFLGYRGQAKLSDVRESQLKEESELNMSVFRDLNFHVAEPRCACPFRAESMGNVAMVSAAGHSASGRRMSGYATEATLILMMVIYTAAIASTIHTSSMTRRCAGGSTGLCLHCRS